jgi:hypothetical protein
MQSLTDAVAEVAEAADARRRQHTRRLLVSGKDTIALGRSFDGDRNAELSNANK